MHSHFNDIVQNWDWRTGNETLPVVTSWTHKRRHTRQRNYRLFLIIDWDCRVVVRFEQFSYAHSLGSGAESLKLFRDVLVFLRRVSEMGHDELRNHYDLSGHFRSSGHWWSVTYRVFTSSFLLCL